MWLFMSATDLPDSQNIDIFKSWEFVKNMEHLWENKFVLKLTESHMMAFLSSPYSRTINNKTNKCY